MFVQFSDNTGTAEVRVENWTLNPLRFRQRSLDASTSLPDRELPSGKCLPYFRDNIEVCLSLSLLFSTDYIQHTYEHLSDER